MHSSISMISDLSFDLSLYKSYLNFRLKCGISPMSKKKSIPDMVRHKRRNMFYNPALLCCPECKAKNSEAFHLRVFESIIMGGIMWDQREWQPLRILSNTGDGMELLLYGNTKDLPTNGDLPINGPHLHFLPYWRHHFHLSSPKLAFTHVFLSSL